LPQTVGIKTVGINAVGTKAVSIKDVAKHAGVSVGTVSNVINRPDRVSEQTRTKVQATIEQLGFVRSEPARQLRVGRSRVFAMLVLDLADPFFAQVARGAAREARSERMGVMLCDSANDPIEEAEYLALFVEQQVRGVLVTPADPTGANLAVLRRRRIPYVLVDRSAPVEHGCSVSVDDVAGGRLATEHLLAQGHRSLTYISGPMHMAQCRDRRTGALAALAAHGVPEDALTHLEAPRLDIAAGREAGIRLLQLSRPPTAVFCANDLLALGVSQAVFAAGIPVPERLSIVGYGDIDFAASAAVSLTSVRQPTEQIGRMAAKLLMDETGTDAERHVHQRVVLEPELVVRASSTVAPGPGHVE
jgi:LacI family transcriptional regulator